MTGSSFTFPGAFREWTFGTLRPPVRVGKQSPRPGPGYSPGEPSGGIMGNSGGGTRSSQGSGTGAV